MRRSPAGALPANRRRPIAYYSQYPPGQLDIRDRSFNRKTAKQSHSRMMAQPATAHAVAVTLGAAKLVGIAGGLIADKSIPSRHSAPTPAVALAGGLLRGKDRRRGNVSVRPGCRQAVLLAPRQQDTRNKHRHTPTDRRHKLPPAVSPLRATLRSRLPIGKSSLTVSKALDGRGVLLRAQR